MAGSKGDVELVIRAKNEASKNLDAVNKSLKALADQQTLAGNSAGSAGGKFAQLGQQLNQLKTNAANLKSLSSIASVLDVAAGALTRLRASAADAGTSLETLQKSQAKLAADSTAAANASKATADAVKLQDKAYKGAQKSVRDLASESTKLANAEKATQASIIAAGETIGKLNARLTESVAKQNAAAAAVAGSENATKRQIASLDAANSALARRQAALDAAVAKESALRTSLENTRTAMAQNNAALEVANKALQAQAKVLADARAANTASAAALANLGSAQKAVAADIEKANKAHLASVAALNAAEKEYRDLQAVAAAAQAAVGATAPALNASGAAAGRAAIQVATLAARLAALNGAGGSKSAALGIDPAAIANADGKVRELGVTIRLAANEATKASVTVDQLKAAVVGLGNTKNQLTGLTQTMTQQQAAVAGAKAAWQAAREEQLRLAAAMKATTAPSAELAAGLGRAQAAAKLAWQAFKDERTAADEMTASLQRAGVGSGSFASAQAALAARLQAIDAQIKSGNASLSRLPAVLNAAGAGAGSAEPKVNQLKVAMTGLLGAVNGLASKTNPLGGLTGSIVSAVGAAAGLYGIKDQLDKILQAGLELNANKARFNVAFGGVEEGSKELEYARKVAENLKLPINDLTKGYSQLALAAKGTALEGEGARKIFEAFAQSTRVNQSSTADLGGVFTALTQIISKGKVQLEELSGQLGDRLPGALQLMSEGLGVTTADLLKMTQKGELTRETLLNMASAVSGRVASELKAALESPAAQIQNFSNQVTKLRETIAGSGFLDAFAAALEKVSVQLSSPDAIQGAKDLGKALGEMITWLAQAPEHFDGIIASIKALGIAWVALQITSMITNVYAFIVAIGGMAAGFVALDIAMSPVLLGLGVLAGIVATVAGAFGAWKLAEWAYDNFGAFAEGVMNAKLAALDAWSGIKAEWDIVGANLKASFGLVTAYIKNLWLGTIRDILNFAPELTKKLGLGSLLDQANADAKASGDDLAAQQAALEKEITDIKQRNLDRQAENAKQNADDIYNYYEKKFADISVPMDGGLAQGDKTNFPGQKKDDKDAVNFPGYTPKTEVPVGTARVTAAPYVKSTADADAKAADKAAKERVALEKSVANEMYGIRAKLESKSANDLQEKIDAVPAKYAALYAKLDQLGKGEGDRDRKELDGLVAIEQQRLRDADAVKKEKEAKKAAHDEAMAQNAEEKQMMSDLAAIGIQRKTIQEELGRALEQGDDDSVATLRESLEGLNADYAVAIESAIGFWAVSDDPKAEQFIAQIERVRSGLTKLKDTAVLTTQTVGKMFGEKLLGGVDSFVQGIADGKGAVQSFKDAFLDFARQFLIRIAQMILQQLILNAIGGAIGNTAGTIGGAISSGLGGGTTPAKHGGGVVGSVGGMKKTGVNPAVFATAARMHVGGEAGATGIRSDEVATVLQKGEVVRTEAQEAALQANQSSGPAEPSPVNLKIVNAIDSASVLNEGLSSVPGQQVFMNFLRANKGKIQGILN